VYKVYVLKSLRDKKSYVGITNNIQRRLIQHNSGNSYYTKRHKPWKIVYTETFENIIEARKREKYFKSASGRRYLKKFVFKK
jgi:putative endonuclease